MTKRKPKKQQTSPSPKSARKPSTPIHHPETPPDPPATSPEDENTIDPKSAADESEEHVKQAVPPRETRESEEESIAVDNLPSNQSLLERIQDLENRLAHLQSKHSDRIINDALRDAYISQGGLPSAANTAVLAIRAGHPDTFQLDEQGDLLFTDNQGEPLYDNDGLDLTPESFLRNWLSENRNFLVAAQRVGSGSAPSESASLSDQEIIQRIRSASSPEEIIKLAAALGIK